MWLQQAIDNFPQLQGQFRETAAPVMNLQQIIARQEAANPTDPATPPNDDVRCIPKVMQVITLGWIGVTHQSTHTLQKLKAFSGVLTKNSFIYLFI